MKYSGIAIAVVGAGVVVGLSACGPKSLAAHRTTPSGSPSASMSAGASGSGSGGSGAMTAGNASASYHFTTLDDPADPTFNQLLGMNGHGMIAGYFGSGAVGKPNKGYALARGAAGFVIHNENFPGSVQTQVIGVNDSGTTVGFWSGMNAADNNDNTGFVDIHGSFRSVKFPAASNSAPPVNQLLGVNNENVAVGFYNDAQNNAHGYTYSILSGRFAPVTVSGAASVTPAGINDFGDVAGFMTNASGTTEGFLKTRGGHVTALAVPGASMTQATGINDGREVVGNYQVGTGNSAVTHGFTWSPRVGFQTVDDPQGVGATIINGVNPKGKLVGFYTDSAGNTDGFVASPVGQPVQPGLAGSMASPTASPTSSMMMPTSSPSMMPSSSPTAMPTSSMSTKPAPMPTTSQPGRGAPSVSPSNLQPTHY